MDNYRKYIPCGEIHTNGKSYYLLRCEPILPDSWQRDNERRFHVVPQRPIIEDDEGNLVFPFSRHIVTNSFVIEFHQMKEIFVEPYDEWEESEWEVPEPTNYVEGVDAYVEPR